MNCDSDTPTYAVVQNDPEAMIKALESMISLLRNGMLKVESGAMVFTSDEFGTAASGFRKTLEVNSNLVLIFK